MFFLFFVMLFLVYCVVKLIIVAILIVWAALTPKREFDTTQPYTSWHLTHEPHKIK